MALEKKVFKSQDFRISPLELEYIVIKILLDNYDIHINAVYSLLEKYGIHSNSIYRTGLEFFLRSKFNIIRKNHLFASAEQINAYKKTQKLVKIMADNTLLDDMQFPDNEITYLLESSDLTTSEGLLYEFFYTFDERVLEIEKLKQKLTGSFALEVIIDDIQILKKLQTKGCYSLEDFLSLKSSSLISLFFGKYQQLKEIFDFSYNDIKSYLCMIVDQIYSNLKTNELEILKLRVFNTTKMVLEDIGNMYNLTRERIRQIENSTIRKIKGLDLVKKLKKTVSLLFDLLKTDNYLSLWTIENYLNSSSYAAKLKVFFDEESDIVFDSKYDLFYKSRTSPSEVEASVLKHYGNIIRKEGINEGHRKLLSYFYNEKETLLIKIGVPKREVVLELIDCNFPQGYRISNDEHYLEIRKLLKTNFDYTETMIPSKRSVAVALENAKYCLIDRGTYKNMKFCLSIPKDLFEKIEEYIIQNPPLVFYRTLFAVFNKQLQGIGINNHNYLKGIIDPIISKKFKTCRDWITITDENINAKEMIKKFIEDSPNGTNYKELKNHFIGIANSVLYSVTSMNEDLITLSKGKIISIEYINTNNELRDALKSVIDKELEKSSNKTVTAFKIFSSFKEYKHQFLDVITCPFDLFSIAWYMFGGLYNFRRPFIGVLGSKIVSNEQLLQNFIETHSEFDKKTLSTFCRETGTRMPNSYLEFLINNSASFMQISKNGMRKKENISFTDKEINNIKENLEILFIRYEVLDLSKISIYDTFYRKEGLTWNKYSLSGFIRSYLNDTFLIEYTEKKYDTTSFLVRKI